MVGGLKMRTCGAGCAWADPASAVAPAAAAATAMMSRRDAIASAAEEGGLALSLMDVFSGMPLSCGGSLVRRRPALARAGLLPEVVAALVAGRQAEPERQHGDQRNSPERARRQIAVCHLAPRIAVVAPRRG